MAQQRGAKRAVKVLKRKQRQTYEAKVANLKRLERQAEQPKEAEVAAK